jgi:hypothetical protein
MDGVTRMSGERSAAQPRGGSCAFVGRRSSVSSSSARWASSASDHPRARAMQSATCQVGLALPASISRSRRTLIPAASASASCFRFSSRRRRPIARPIATCGVGLRGTPEASGYDALVTRNYSAGMGIRAPGPLCSGSVSLEAIQSRPLAVACLRVLQPGEPARRGTSRGHGRCGPLARSWGSRRPRSWISAPGCCLRRALSVLGSCRVRGGGLGSRRRGRPAGLGVGASPGTLGVSRANYHTFMDDTGRSVGGFTARTGARTPACRYSMSRSRSAGVVPRARASRRSMFVVGSRRVFSILLICERSTPLIRDRATCEIPAASRAARRLAAS